MMIRLVGALFIVVASYVLGLTKYKNMVLGEKIAEEFAAFFQDLKNAIGFSSASLPAQIEVCAAKEYLSNLTLLDGLSAESYFDRTMPEVLCDRLDNWEHATSMTKDERSVVRALFLELGRRNLAGEADALEHAALYMNAFQKKRKSINEKRKGFYEAVFTLCGIAVAIILL